MYIQIKKTFFKQADALWGCHCPIQQQVEAVVESQNYQKEHHEKQIVVIKDDVPLCLHWCVYALLCWFSSGQDWSSLYILFFML